MIKKSFTLLSVCLVFLSIGVNAFAFPDKIFVRAKLVMVTDGDTATFQSESGQQFKCRLYGIDAPEMSQPFGLEAKQYLEYLLKKGSYDWMTIFMSGEKSYGREICKIKRTGEDVNLKMLSEGYAWAYNKYLYKEDIQRYRDHEEMGKKISPVREGNKIVFRRKGLWQDPNPIPPWEHRQAMKKLFSGED